MADEHTVSKNKLIGLLILVFVVGGVIGGLVFTRHYDVGPLADLQGITSSADLSSETSTLFNNPTLQQINELMAENKNSAFTETSYNQFVESYNSLANRYNKSEGKEQLNLPILRVGVPGSSICNQIANDINRFEDMRRDLVRSINLNEDRLFGLNIQIQNFPQTYPHPRTEEQLQLINQIILQANDVRYELNRLRENLRFVDSFLQILRQNGDALRCEFRVTAGSS